jgi:hypothetical protein
MPVAFNPIEDHIIKRIKAGSKKTIAKTAVVLRETWEDLVINYGF